MDTLWITTKAADVIVASLHFLDEQCWTYLKAHQHKIVCFHILPLKPLYFEIGEDKLISCVPSDTIHTTFTGPLKDFIAMMFVKNGYHSGIHVRGDMECAKAFYDTWHHLDLDWEGFCAKIVGGPFAYALSSFLKQSYDHVQTTFQARKEDLTAYLQDEIKWLPTQEEADKLYQDIDTIRHDVERFEAKLALLKKDMI